MKTRRVIYYFLFLAVVMGGFASMAQNNYGLTLISVACFAFSSLFILDLFTSDSRAHLHLAETLGLALITALFGLRAAYIHLPYIEWVVVLSAVSLAVVYGTKGYQTFKARSANPRFMIAVVLYYDGLVLLLLSMAIRIFSPELSQLLGGLGFGSLMLFALGYFYFGTQLISGESYTLMDYVRKSSPFSTVLATAFFLISIYTGLYMIKIVPPLYTEKVPPVYLELVRQAENGEERPVGGVYRHDQYKEAYDDFVEKNGK